jgi:HEAT repeat protein
LQNPVDRYAAAKAIPFLRDAESWGENVLLKAIEKEADDRVWLELAASAARIGAEFGMESVSSIIWNHERIDLRMEGVLILTELSTESTAKELVRIAKGKEFVGSEIRQAAVWGMGKAGSHSYRRLIEFISDDEEGVALHAISAFGPDTPADVINELVLLLENGSPRNQAAASAAIKTINSDMAIRKVIRAAKKKQR